MKWTSVLAAVLLAGGVAQAQDNGAPSPTLKPALAPALKPVPGALPPRAPTDATPRELTKADVDTWLEGYMPYALRSADIPGAVVVVVKDGKMLTARGFGYANAEKRTPVDPDRTLFRPGSVSKLFTWTAVMQLVEQHKLDLDADVNMYLDFKIPPFDGKPVTLRQLMTHTGGFEEAAKGIITYEGAENPTLGAYLKRWTPARIFAPGSTPAYSNWATALSAYIVQRVSREDFDSYLEHHIFQPLGMHNATFRQPLPAALAAQMATGYPKPGEPKGFEFIGPAPAGSASVSGTDMGRFMLAHLKRGELDGQRILSPETADMMHDSPLTRVDPHSLVPPLNRMELGFFETNINGREVIGHLGDTSAFHSSLHLFMKDGVGFYVSFNSPGKAAAVQALRTAIFEDFADRYFPNIAPADGHVDAKFAADHVRMMAGNWIASRRPDSSFLSAIYWLGGQTEIAAGPKGELVVPSVVNAAGRPRQWVEIAPYVWRNADGHDRIAAKVENGKVVRWSFDLAAPFEVFDPVPASRSSKWLIPALSASLGVLLLTALFWPFAWVVRRNLKVPLSVTGQALRARRATQLTALLLVVLAGGWFGVATAILSTSGDTAGYDPLLWALQIGGAVVFVGMVLVSGWNLWMALTDKRGWMRKLWAVLVFASALMLLYVAVTFNLMAMTVHY